MPPRRSARVAAAVEQRACAFPQLPLSLALRIFSRLPVDQLLRCAEVSRGWRATVALPVLWQRLDLSPASGMVFRLSEEALAALLRAAVARAGSALKVLDVSDTGLRSVAVCAALRAAAGVEELHRFNLIPALGIAAVNALLAAAPRLRELHTSVYADWEDAVAVLEARPPFGPLKVHTLFLGAQTGALPAALALALANNLLQPTMHRMMLNDSNLSAPGALDAVANAFIARQPLNTLFLHNCTLSSAAMSPLARALRGDALMALKVLRCTGDFIGAAGAVTLGEALRATRTLETLTLAALAQLSAPAVATLLGALLGHRSLQRLDLSATRFEDPGAAGAALGALIAANAPALTTLDVSACALGQAGLGAVLDALPRNSHVRELHFYRNGVPAGFMRSRLLPAVRANAGLRTLLPEYSFMDRHGEDDDDNYHAMEEAQRIVSAR